MSDEPKSLADRAAAELAELQEKEKLLRRLTAAEMRLADMEKDLSDDSRHVAALLTVACAIFEGGPQGTEAGEDYTMDTFRNILGIIRRARPDRVDFNRRIVSRVECTDSTQEIEFDCGHKAFQAVRLPEWVREMPCAQCVNEFVEECRKKGEKSVVG